MVKPTQPIFTTKTYHAIDAFALDRFIKEVYELKDFDGHLESSNDTTHEFTVNGKLDEWEEDDLKKAIEELGCEYYQLGNVLNDLCRKGLIPEGEWLVRVCW